MSKLLKTIGGVLFVWFMLAVLCVGIGFLATSCTKEQSRTADAVVQNTCEVLAADTAAITGKNVEDVIARTCALEKFTRKLREALLSQQMRELYKQDGAAVPAALPAADPYHGVEEAAEPAE